MLKIIAIALVFLSGCSLAEIQRATNRDGMSTEERASLEAKEREEAAKREAAKKNLKPGMTLSEVKYAWGEPDQTEYKGGHNILWYENDGTPMVFAFQNDVLKEYYFDRDYAQKQKALENQKKPTRCTSTPMFGSVVTDCR